MPEACARACVRGMCQGHVPGHVAGACARACSRGICQGMCQDAGTDVLPDVIPDVPPYVLPDVPPYVPSQTPNNVAGFYYVIATCQMCASSGFRKHLCFFGRFLHPLFAEHGGALPLLPRGKPTLDRRWYVSDQALTGIAGVSLQDIFQDAFSVLDDTHIRVMLPNRPALRGEPQDAKPSFVAGDLALMTLSSSSGSTGPSPANAATLGWIAPTKGDRHLLPDAAETHRGPDSRRRRSRIRRRFAAIEPCRALQAPASSQRTCPR